MIHYFVTDMIHYFVTGPVIYQNLCRVSYYIYQRIYVLFNGLSSANEKVEFLFFAMYLWRPQNPRGYKLWANSCSSINTIPGSGDKLFDKFLVPVIDVIAEIHVLI